VLPVRLNPPDTRQMPAGALALIMHSCEMAQGNYWGQKVAQSAIEALSRLDYAGIVEYGGGVGGIQGCSWAFQMQRLGDKKAALDATKTMRVGDMPSFAPSMQLALQGFDATTASQRHAIIISDGDPSPPSQALLQKYVDKKVTVTTIMVGGHGTGIDRNRMQAVANKTGGTFYNVTNPKQLPQIFIKEALIVSRSLIQDGDLYQPTARTALTGPTQGFTQVPAIDGYVLTAPREGLAQNPIVIGTTEGNDPLLSFWNYGLGRSIAYTSDLSNLWGARWASWSRFRAFWEQAIRWSMRPSAPTNMHVSTRFEGTLAIVEVEALDADASSLNFLEIDGTVLSPEYEPARLSLQQTGPGRYRGEFQTDAAGAYLINIGFRSDTGSGTTQGTIQAAVTVPYAPEFRSVKHNRAKLEQLAAATGGRMLQGDDPMLADLFNRDDLEVPRSLKRIWDLMAILAASLLLFDVAARRISFDPMRARAAAARAVGRRGDVSQDTVAAWKRTKANVAHRRTSGELSAKAAVRKDGASRTAKFEASETDAAKAIDVGAETSGEPTGRPQPQKARDAATATPEEEPGEYTSRLLAAKRRAAQRPGEKHDGDGADG